jgi:hypothetical protein
LECNCLAKFGERLIRRVLHVFLGEAPQDNFRHEALGLKREDHWDEFRGAVLSIINLECDELAFPIHSVPDVWLLVTTESTIVSSKTAACPAFLEALIHFLDHVIVGQAMVAGRDFFSFQEAGLLRRQNKNQSKALGIGMSRSAPAGCGFPLLQKILAFLCCQEWRFPKEFDYWQNIIEVRGCETVSGDKRVPLC